VDRYIEMTKNINRYIDPGAKFLCILAALACMALLSSCGEKFRDQGDQLSVAIHAELQRAGRCNDAQDCKDKFVLLGEHGNQVNLNMYGVTDRTVRSDVLRFVSTSGTAITGGVPIALSFYSDPKSELVSGHQSADPDQTLRINK
jgi:hypothetical protein